MTESFDLVSAAREEMIQAGFDPNVPELASSPPPPALAPGVRDLRQLLWSSIDNDTSRDLDQVEYAERTAAGIRVLVGIADVDQAVAINSVIDQYAAKETTTVYTAVHNFPMLPEVLSTNLTSLAENQDRLAIVIEFIVAADGNSTSPEIYRALLHNYAQLTYDNVGNWLEGRAPADPKVAASVELQAQLKLQDAAATALHAERRRQGALDFDRTEAVAVTTNDQVQEIRAAHKTRANLLIEDFMIAANEVMARTLKNSGSASIRRVVKSPERWPRIVAIAAQYGDQLPVQPDSRALNAFLEMRKAADPVHYADLSLSIVKLMGPGEYAVTHAGDNTQGHFALAVPDYTHSTAPNRRFTDLVTQRLIKAVIAGTPEPYTAAELETIAKTCNVKESAARKVERAMNKRVAAVAMQRSIGRNFKAVITGVNPKGVFLRLSDPPVDGILCKGQEGLDVGDQIDVTLLAADPERGYIDFARV